jgi:hypothetical protein
MWCSTFPTITSHNRPSISEFEDEWRINNLLGRPQNDQSDCFSNFSYTRWREVTKFENGGSPEVVAGAKNTGGTDRRGNF